MIDKIIANCLMYPTNIAYIVDDTKLSYECLLKEARILEGRLKEQGTEPVIIYGHKSKYMVISIFACLLANRAYVPLDLCMPRDRVTAIIKKTGATLLIDNSADYMQITELDNEIISTVPINTAYIIFTSGSTGIPSPVLISRLNLANFTTWMCKLEPLDTYRHIVVLNQASFSFDLSVADLFYALIGGHTLLASTKDVQSDLGKLEEMLEANQPDMAVMTPTFIKMCLLNPDFNRKNLSNLKAIYFCGETLEPITVKKLLMRFNDLTVINAYGPTEATSAVAGVVIVPEMLERAMLPVGDVLSAATSITILNGEIVLKGPSVFNGYLDLPSKNFYYENGIPTYKTGDLGYIEDNLLYCKGRIDNQVKYKGYRIELGDIENNLLNIDGVKEAVVIAIKENNQTKALKAFIIKEDDKEMDVIIDDLKRSIPAYMIPKVFMAIDYLPVNKNGKIDRAALGEL